MGSCSRRDNETLNMIVWEMSIPLNFILDFINPCGETWPLPSCPERLEAWEPDFWGLCFKHSAHYPNAQQACPQKQTLQV